MGTTVELDYYGPLPEEPDYSNYEDTYDEAMMDYQQDSIDLQNRNTGEPPDNGYATVKVHVFDSKDDFMEALKKSDELKGSQGEQEYYSYDDNEVYYNDYVSRASNPHLGYVGKLEVFKE